MSDPTPLNPDLSGDETVSAPTVEELQAQIAILTQERDDLQAQVDAMPQPVEPILFPNFQEFVTRKEAEGTSRLDLQALVFSRFAIPLDERGFTVEMNTSTAEGGNGRESSNGVSHKSQYLLSDTRALAHIDPSVLAWYASQKACKVVFGETSYISADDAAAKSANATTGQKFQR
jgi:hypothetical protein